MQEENKYIEHEVNIMKIISKYIKPYGTVLSSEPINDVTIRINFIQRDKDESWLQALDNHLKLYRDAGIIAGAQFKYAAEWTDDVRFGALILIFNPVWQQKYLTTFIASN